MMKQKLMRSQGCPKAPFHPMCLALTVAGIDSPQSELLAGKAKQSLESEIKILLFASQPLSNLELINFFCSAKS